MSNGYFKDNGYFVDETLDGGDSAVRAGISSGFGKEFESRVWHYVNDKGICVRHPTQMPWQNPNNFSRDQLICLCLGLWSEGRFTALNAIFWSHFKRAFFCQNIDRDHPGTTKYPFPHQFMYNGKLIKRSFDFRDPLLPHDIWYLIKAAEIKWLYPFAIIGIPSFIISLIIHCKGKHNEDNQILSQCMVNGAWAVSLFKHLKPNWRDKVTKYWETDRREPYFSRIIISKIEKI